MTRLLLLNMAKAKHYCAECQTHFGGPPNYISPEEHANIEHDGGIFRGIKDGNFRDWKRRNRTIVD